MAVTVEVGLSSGFLTVEVDLPEDATEDELLNEAVETIEHELSGAKINQVWR